MPFATATATPGDAPGLPAASYAIADTTWLPSATVCVFHEMEYGAAVTGEPTFAPSTWNCTLVTPTLSAAVATTVTAPSREAPPAGAVTVAVGGVVSAVAAACAVKFTPVTLAPDTATVRVGGVNVKPALDGVTMYDPFGRLEKLYAPLTSAVVCVSSPPIVSVVPAPEATGVTVPPSDHVCEPATAGRTSQIARLKRSAVGAVSLIVTVVPAVGV